MIPEQTIEDEKNRKKREKEALEYLIQDAQETGGTQKITDALVSLKALLE